MPYPVNLSWLGVARETTKFTAVAPTFWIPVKSPSALAQIKYHPDEGYRGAMAQTYGMIQGVENGEYSCQGDVFPDAIGFWLGALLGDVVGTGTASGGSTTLAALSAVGAVTVSSTATEPATTILQIDTGSKAEIRSVVSVSGAGPFTLTLNSPLSFAHSNGATVQPVVAPFTNAFAPYSLAQGQAPALTVSDFNGFNMRQFAGAEVSEVAFKFTAEELFQYTTKVFSAAPVTGTAPAISFSATAPIPGWNCTSKVAGSTITKLWSLDLTLARMNLAPIWTAQASQQPYSIFGGPITAKGKIMFVYEDDTELNYYINNTQPALDVTLVQQGVSNRSVQIHLSQVAFISPTQAIRGKHYLETEATIEGIANVTDVGGSAGYSPVKVTTISPQGVY